MASEPHDIIPADSSDANGPVLVPPKRSVKATSTAPRLSWKANTGPSALVGSGPAAPGQPWVTGWVT